MAVVLCIVFFEWCFNILFVFAVITKNIRLMKTRLVGFGANWRNYTINLGNTRIRKSKTYRLHRYWFVQDGQLRWFWIEYSNLAVIFLGRKCISGRIRATAVVNKYTAVGQVLQVLLQGTCHTCNQSHTPLVVVVVEVLFENRHKLDN